MDSLSARADFPSSVIPDSTVKEEEFENKVAKPFWGPWATIGFGIVTAIVFIVTQVVVIGAIIAVKMASDTQFDIEHFAGSLAGNGMVFSLSTFATTIVCGGLVLLIIKVRKGTTIKAYLGLNPIDGKTLLGLLALSAGIIFVSDSLSLLINKPIVHPFMVESYQTKGSTILLWAAVVLAAPAFEETFFRGFLFEGIRHSRIGNIGAVGLTALIWTAIHVQYGTYELATLFVLGVVLGIVRIKTASLTSCLVMHSFWNFVATVETALFVHGVTG